MKRAYLLTEAVVNTILGALSELPFREANPIIVDLIQQHTTMLQTEMGGEEFTPPLPVIVENIQTPV